MPKTIQSALQNARQQIQAASDSASLDSQVLLAEVLSVDRSYLLSHPEHVLTDEQESRFCGMGRTLRGR